MKSAFTSSSRKTIYWLIGTACTLLVIVGGFAGYAGYYALSHKVLPGVKVGNVSVSGMTEKEIVEKLDDSQKNIQITLETPKESLKLSLADLGYQIDSKKTAEKALAPNSSFSAYFSALFSDHLVKPIFTSNPNKIVEVSSKLSKDMPDYKKATEPTVSFDGTKKYTAIAGKTGYGIDPNSIKTAMEKIMATLEAETIKPTTGVTQPIYSTEDAQKLADSANQILGVEIKIKAGDKNTPADTATKASWLKLPEISDNPQINVDSEALTNWVAELKKPILAKKVDGKRYKNTSGKIVKVEIEKKDGVEVTNQDDLVKEISNNLLAKKEFQGEFATKVTPSKWTDKIIADGAEKLAYLAAPGEKWIDVNLRNHTTTAYEGSKVVRGPVSMVNGAPATPTVVGKYSLERKYRSKTMKGRNADGTPYVTENVPYAMYFHQGYALHGAPWRSSFGHAGSGGSHGCINMPVGESKWFYNWSDIGTPVITHH